MNRSRTSLLVWLIAAFLTPGMVSAQGDRSGQGQPSEPLPPEVRRPFRGLFGKPMDPSKSSLVFTGSLMAAYNDDIYAVDSGTGSSVTNSPQSRGIYEAAQAGVQLNLPGDSVSFSSDSDVAVNYYQTRDDMSTNYRTAAQMGIRFSRRTRMSVEGSFVYAPEYRLGVFASAADLGGIADPFDTVGADQDLFRLKSYRSAGSVVFEQSIGRRTTMSATYALAFSNYVGENLDYRSQGGGISFEHQLSRNMSARLGYLYSVADYTQRRSYRPQAVHNIDAGIDYGRALSISRRTSLRFSTGSALVVSDETPLDPTGRQLNYRFIGSATLKHELGRTWTAAAAYQRGVDFHEGFAAPFLSDGVVTTIRGLLSRRLTFEGAANYSFGTVGFNSENKFNSASANAGLEYGLSQAFALFARYVYYQYEFDTPAALDPRFARGLSRQGARVGLSFIAHR